MKNLMAPLTVYFVGMMTAYSDYPPKHRAHQRIYFAARLSTNNSPPLMVTCTFRKSQ